MFNHENYIKINGTVMGTTVAPIYANLFMNSPKETFIYPQANCPRIWFRFMDDIWVIFRGTEKELNSFVEYCNSFHETIKFMVEYSKKSFTFLDVTTNQE